MSARRAKASLGLLLLASWLTWPACTAVDPLKLQISGKDVVDQASAALPAISGAEAARLQFDPPGASSVAPAI